MAAAAARAKAAASQSSHHHHLGHQQHHHSRGLLHASPANDRQRHHHHHHHHHHQVAPLKVHLSSQQHRHHSQKTTRSSMYESYQLWAMKTYGDSAKTKTVTRKKYNRIVKTLKGEEQTNAENSKFRFWVKAKGFRIGPPPNHPNESRKSEMGVLFVVCSTQSKCGSALAVEEDEEEGGGGTNVTSGIVYKKVAVVENFFDIIYNVHVEMDGRGGKHAGQKKTYKAIAEMYAFLPREAVTKFLMQCSDCQKRMHPGVASASFSSGSVHTSIQPPTSTTSTATSNKSTASASQLPSKISTASPHSSSSNSSATNPGVGDGGGLGEGGGGDENSMDRTEPSVDPPEINFSLPITTTYLKHLRSLGYSEEEALNDNRDMNDDVMGHDDSGNSNDIPASNSEPGSPIPFDDQMSPSSCKEVSSPSSSLRPNDEEGAGGYDDHPIDMTTAGDGTAASPTWSHHSGSPPSSPKWPSTAPAISSGSSTGAPISNHQLPINMCRNGDASSDRIRNSASSTTSPSFHHRYSLSSRHHSHRHHPHTRRSFSDAKTSVFRAYNDAENGDERPVSPAGGSSPVLDSLVVKDEDEEDDDEADDEKTPQQCDPERLKAFNLFVRLFVDENLDRMVPISKQPKEKIQAIMDSCARQFPEFSERSRKRIRTYLKSCRRTKRCRDQNGWDPARPTPPHLTSAMAEQILANACENESTNAKRMRLGLEPICTNLPGERESTKRISEPVIQQPSNLRSYISDAHRNGLPNGSLSHRIHSNVIATRGGSPSRYAGIKTESKTSSHYTKNSLTNGPADLSTKRTHLPLGAHHSPTGSQSTQSKCPLNPSEVSAVRQLIAGYRESAAFLVRSAEELEQLLLQQN